MIETLYLLLPIIYALINAASYALYGIDKFKAKKDKWRISESSLLLASFFGPVGALLGMQHFRHKTQNPVFKFLVPMFAGIHLLLILWINL
jgi:uncharacterized membrane protein YsdA (DUF1294 family)